MVASITSFESTHIPAALQLWQTTDYIGLSSDDTPDALRRFLAANPGLSYCATTPDGLVGTIVCGSDGRRGYIHHLAVAGHYRHRGIGNSLVRQSLEALADIGIMKCHALVFRENPYAELFWRASGWELREDLLVFSKTSPSPGE